MVSLEHRYYGASQPFADLATPHLRFLSANQALADLATFHAFYEVTGVEGHTGSGRHRQMGFKAHSLCISHCSLLYTQWYFGRL